MSDEEVVADSVFDNLQKVCKEALLHDGLKRGLHEVAHYLDAHQGRLCLLAEDCDKDEYLTLIQALCQEGGCPIQMIPSRDQLGNIVGLGEACSEKKPVKCTCAVITNFGREIEAFQSLKTQIALD